MRLLKKQVLLRLVNSYIVDSPQPANLSYLWNFGSLLGTCLILQILTGIFLAMHYQPHVDFAFNSVEHIMRDVNNGWAVRYTHANVASFFFIFVYAQISNIISIKLLNSQHKINLISNNKFNFADFFKSKIITDFLNIIKPKNMTAENNQKIEQPSPSSNLEKDFIEWFVGFSDAESSFMINTRNNKEVHFIFQITLHIEDIGTLYTIREKLGFGVISIKGNTCSFYVRSFKNIVEKLLPIFDKCSLLTHKQLNYRDWRKAVILKKLEQENSRSLGIDAFNEIVRLKNSINTQRINFEGYSVSKDMLTKNWLIGFIEGDGTFYFSNSSVVLGISQKDKQILESISDFLNNIPISPPFNNLVVPGKPNCIIKNNTNSYQLVITDKDVLFQYIYPYFIESSFYSRKRIDFTIWSLVLYLFILGYHNLPKGKEVLLKLSNSMNSKRYFSDLSDLIDLDEIKSLFEIEPPFDIYSGKSNFILAKEYSLYKGSRKGFKVYIYKNGVEIKGSPFDSFRSGGKAIKLNSVSSIRNYLDTGKIFKDGYTFYSTPHTLRVAFGLCR